MKIEKIAVFDFCDTIYSGQSLNDFIDFIVRENFIKFYYVSIISYLYKLGFIRPDVRKSLILKVFKNFEKKKYELVCQKFYNEVVKENFKLEVISKMLEANQKGFHILVLSGGLYDYIKFLKNDFPVHNIIANRLIFDHGLCTGFIDKPECLGIGKLEKFSKIYSTILTDYSESVFYTDHVSDSVLFPIFKENIIVTTKGSCPIWVKNLNLKVIES